MAPTERNIDRLVAELDNAARQLRRMRREAAREVHAELESAQLVMLSTLATDGPMRMSELAAAVGVDKGPVSRGCARLVELKMVKRTGDKTDARASSLAATAAGKRLAARYDAALSLRFDRASDRQTATTAGALGKLFAALG